MSYIVTIPHRDDISWEWLIENFGGPVYTTSQTGPEGRTAIGYVGNEWVIWGEIDNNLRYVTIGEFENKEQAVLFELRWA